MRVCLLTHVFPAHREDPLGIFVLELARGLVRRGHSVHVVTPWREGSPESELLDGVQIHRFRHWGRFAKRLGELERIPWDTMASFLASWIRSALRVIRTHDLELIHAYWVVPGGLVGVLAGQVSNLPVVATAAGTDLNQVPRNPVLRQPVRRTLMRLARLIALGTPLQDKAVALGLSPHRSRVILNDGGNDPMFYRPQGMRTQAQARGEKLLLYVGRLAYPKRIDTILRAMPRILERHPGARFRIVGDGEEREALADLTRELKLDCSVEFAGARPHDRIPQELDQSALFLYPTENEGIPSAISEAMSFGVPVVASPVGGIPDMIRHGETGLLARFDDPADFAGNVVSLLDDPDRTARITEAARRFAHRQFSPETILSQVEEVYREALVG